jgi:hypothetical protein
MVSSTPPQSSNAASQSATLAAHSPAVSGLAGGRAGPRWN